MHDPLVRVMLSGGCFQLMSALVEKATKNVEFIRGASLGDSPRALPMRLDAGEIADVIVFAEDAFPRIRGFLHNETSKRFLAGSSIGIGTVSPKYRSAPTSFAELLDLLRDVEAFGYSTSVSGQYVMHRLAELGVSVEICKKGVPSGDSSVGRLLLNGNAQIGFQQISELLEIKGVRVLGEVPAEIQKRTNYYIGVLERTRNVGEANRLIDEALACRTLDILTGLGLSAEEKLGD